MKKWLKWAGIALAIVVCIVAVVLIATTNNNGNNDDSAKTTEGSSTNSEEKETTHIHTEVIDEAVAPTCTSAGLTEGKHCSVCNQTIVAQREIEALEHLEVNDNAISSTCFASGKTQGSRCLVCEAVIVQQEDAPIKDHSECNWHEIPTNDCASDYYYVRICTDCKAIEYGFKDNGITHPHDFEMTVVEATCTSEGYIKIVCKNCGIIGANEIISAMGHEIIWTISGSTHSSHCTRVDCDYTTDVESHFSNTDCLCKSAYCTVCYYVIRTGRGHIIDYVADETYHWKDCIREDCNCIWIVKDEHVAEGKYCIDNSAICDICQHEFDPTNHKIGNWDIIIPATCTESGEKQGTCDYCGQKETEAIDPLGHDFGEWIIIKESTLSEPGLKERKCKRCDYVEQQTIPHKCSCYSWESIQEPTCTEYGIKKSICVDCGCNIYQYIYPLGHDWKSYEYNDTQHWRTCNRCHKTEINNHEGGKPTCDASAICSLCNTPYGDPLGHKYSKDFDYNDNVHYHLCLNNCGNKIDVDEHLLTGKVETLTITNASNQIKYTHKFYIACELCEYKHLINTTENAEHYGCKILDKVEPTCTKTGLDWGYKCSVAGCDEVYLEQALIPALGHEYNENYVCIRCGERYYSKGLEYTLNSQGTAYEISRIGECTDTNIVIPNEYEGLPVTSIGKHAFSSCDSCISVTIPNSVINIDDSAFAWCSSLTNIIIPDSVVNIGDSAFAWCSNLTDITIPSSVAIIGYRAFESCSNLTNISVSPNNQYYSSLDGNLYNKNKTKLIQYSIGKNNTNFSIPNGITKIEDYAFYCCENLTNITIPDTVTHIGNHTFYNCWNLSSINIPNSVVSIGDTAFGDCSSLTNINIPDNITQLGRTVFYRCERLANINVSINNLYYSSIDGNLYNKDKTELIQYAFGKNSTHFTIPNGVTKIGYGAFEWCSTLTSIKIPDSVTIIEECAFYRCENLTSINIPDGVTRIHSLTFNNCYNLIEKENGVSYIDNCVVSFDDSISEVTLREGIRIIADYSFHLHSNLTSVTLPNSVISIGDSAFSFCPNLVSINLPESIKIIGDMAFGTCANLENINIPNSLTEMGKYIFNNSPNLKFTEYDNAFYLGNSQNPYLVLMKLKPDISSFNINNKTKFIYSYAFSNQYNLSNIIIPDGVISIGDYAFENCYSLTSITIPDSVISIGDYAFNNCDELRSIIVGQNNANYSSVDGNLYNHDKTILIKYAVGKSDTSFTIPDTVTSIDDYAFRGGNSLTHIKISNNVTSIGDLAFGGCISLTNIEIPDSITSISDYMFSGCSSLTSIYIPDSITSIGKDAFYNCDNLTTLTIGKGVTMIGDYAFGNCDKITTIYFSGTVEKWTAITQGLNNTNLTNATIIYNYQPE